MAVAVAVGVVVVEQLIQHQPQLVLLLVSRQGLVLLLVSRKGSKLCPLAGPFETNQVREVEGAKLQGQAWPVVLIAAREQAL